MHDFWHSGGYEGDQIHIDWVTIPGAKIQDLQHAWRRDYRHEKRPMDVLVVGGLNNVRNESTSKIMERIDEFATTVLAQSEEFHPEAPSTFSFATMFLPPQYARFPGDDSLPIKSFDNKLAMMMDLNEKITQLNNNIFQKTIEVFKSQNGGVAGEKPKTLGLHKYGMRKLTKKYPNGKVVAVRTHRWEHFRETEKEQMLHLNDEQRAKVGRAINNYFINQFVPKRL